MHRQAHPFEELVRQHASDLYRLALRLCGDPVAAEDLVQETYLEAWRSLHDLRQPDRARAWLMQILRHRFRHLLRAASRRPRTRPATEDLVFHVPERDWALQEALARLPVSYREPFLLVFMEGYRCREVAEMLNLPLGTVLSRIHRARSRLRTLLDPVQKVVPMRRQGGGPQ